MNPIALFTMLTTLVIVTGVTIYFFYRVYTAPPKPEPDSFIENDSVDRKN